MSLFLHPPHTKNKFTPTYQPGTLLEYIASAPTPPFFYKYTGIWPLKDLNVVSNKEHYEHMVDINKSRQAVRIYGKDAFLYLGYKPWYEGTVPYVHFFLITGPLHETPVIAFQTSSNLSLAMFKPITSATVL